MINPPSKIKIFLSSRRGYHDIDYQLRDYPVIPMDDPRNAEDIPYFIESEVKELVEEKASLWGSSKSLEADIIGALKEKAGGMFRWVVLQIDHLRDSATPGAVRQRLKQLPATLYALHDEIYERISKMAQSDLDTAEAVLSWLLCAQRRLDYEEFLAAALTNPDEPVTTKQILQICRNLVVQGASGSFDFAHLSVREYLETRPEYKDRQPDVLVAKKCLELLESSTLEDTLGPYASIYWLQHCSGLIMEKRLAGVVERLFSDKGENEMFRTWSIIANRAADALDWDSEARRRLRDTGYNPLSVACVFGFPKVLTQWVNTQPPEYSYLRETDDMVVHLAIKWGNVDVVRLLLQKNGQSAFDNFGLTPAFWAAFFGHQPVLEVLSQLDGCLDAEDDMGWTAWNWMIAIDHMEGLRDLLKVNTGVSMTDQIGWTILHWAAFLGREDQARQLIAAQHKLDAKDNEKRMPFELAAFMRYEETVALLRIGEPSIGSTLGYSGTSLEVMIS
ncbi:hypothetical protein FRC15_005108 [Serendipita sp. 397]|nr:hypothetical protein FRC15_005108 [Serendipita sp. 397]